MEKLESRDSVKLQRMIDDTVATSNAFHDAQARLNDWSRERYGYEPGDIDADVIIDGVFGASGRCPGMTAEDFHKEMTKGR